MASDTGLVGYCGIYCRLCSSRGRVPGQARTLRDTLRKEGFEYWGPEFPGFKEFWGLLDRLAKDDGVCPGCREGGGPPACAIRRCARQKGVELCIACADYPCRHVEALARGYHLLLGDNRRLKEIGLEAWLREQDDRAEAGFCYADVRCPFEMPQGE